MKLVDDSLEWRSVMDALRTISVDTVRSTFGSRGVVAFTDGACIKNPGGPAGWGAILLAAEDVTGGIAREGAKRIECYGHIPASQTTTNNRAEISAVRSEEHTSELQSLAYLVCRLLLEKKKKKKNIVLC